MVTMGHAFDEWRSGRQRTDVPAACRWSFSVLLAAEASEAPRDGQGTSDCSIRWVRVGPRFKIACVAHPWAPAAQTQGQWKARLDAKTSKNKLLLLLTQPPAPSPPFLPFVDSGSVFALVIEPFPFFSLS